MKKYLIAAAAALSLMAGAANAAYAESNNLAGTEVPASSYGISAGSATIMTGSEAYPVSPATATYQSNVAVLDTGAERYQDFAGQQIGPGKIGLAQRNGNNARS
jgi:hypothetical protein